MPQYTTMDASYVVFRRAVDEELLFFCGASLSGQCLWTVNLYDAQEFLSERAVSDAMIDIRTADFVNSWGMECDLHPRHRYSNKGS